MALDRGDVPHLRYRIFRFRSLGPLPVAPSSCISQLAASRHLGWDEGDRVQPHPLLQRNGAWGRSPAPIGAVRGKSSYTALDISAIYEQKRPQHVRRHGGSLNLSEAALWARQR